MAEKLDGTVALVTGASSGIGAAAATALAGQGASVALVARRKERLETLAGEIRKQGGSAFVLAADITREDQANDVIARTVAEFGRLDTLVNAAGVMLLGPALGAPMPEWREMVEINLLGTLYCSHAALPHLIKAAETGARRVADLVNVSSTAGRFPRAGRAVYNATKHGITGFSEALRQEVTTKHVRVCLLEPGAVNTELVSHNRPEIRDTISKFLAFERLEAEDIADAIAYIVTRPRRVAVNELLIRPTEQEG
ncbi:MAG TPA: SDR family NAD(P)-dependent oxidoreductase [Polyangiaceae bacterium]|nr:SDR family NAD(P)-dependent oxidoreductase [Polyangiaceae bacterium]